MAAKTLTKKRTAKARRWKKPVQKWTCWQFCRPPHKVTNPEKVAELRKTIQWEGWNGPSLVGYKDGTRIQLLSGTHRWHALQAMGGRWKCPVMLVEKERVQAAHGNLRAWRAIMNLGDRNHMERY